MKPHYRLHFHLFDGKTPLWWVSRGSRNPARIWNRKRSTPGYSNSGDVIREAAKL